MNAVREPLVLDTGPLFDYLICTFAARGNHGWALKMPSHSELRAESSKRLRLRTWIECATRIRTTPHVVTEVAAHVERAKKKGLTFAPRHREQFWSIALELFAEERFGEEPIPLVDMPRDLMPVDGPADWSVILLAERERGTVLTSESRDRANRMPHRCMARKVPCLTLDELLAV